MRTRTTIRHAATTTLLLLALAATLACSAKRGTNAARNLPPAPAPKARAAQLAKLPPLPPRPAPRLLPLRWEFAVLMATARQGVEVAPAQSEEADAAEEVPAPLDEMPLEFAERESPQLRGLVEQELSSVAFDLPLVVNEHVLSVVDYFQTTRGRRILETGLRRAGRYREMIERVLAEEGVPQDLIYLAQAESAFQPAARSRSRAVGIWQFISSRAQQYGLRVDWWVDERRDPEKATRAAAQHLRDLYERFGDWYLAMAAYNGGPGRVERAIEHTGYADFWELHKRRVLRRETRNYVPIILAMTLMAKNPERYGIEVEPEPSLAVEPVVVDKPTDLRLIANEIGVPVRTLRELNPQLLHNVTPRQRDFRLYVPDGTAESLRAALPNLPEDQRVLWPRHTVRRGDTLWGIARRYGSSPAAVAEVNGISPRGLIHPGQMLIVPPTGNVRIVRELAGGRAPTKAEPATAQATDGQRIHRVQRGETLWGLARRYQTSIEALRRANEFLAYRELQADDAIVVPY